MDNVLKFLTEYADSLTYEKLPKEVVHEVKRRVIDSLGCALGGYMGEPPKIARVHALEATAKQGATVLGTNHRTVPELAAFANGVMVRYLDFNDMSMAKCGGGHPSDNVPGVLAAAEYSGADGRAVITGIVLAYELMDRFGDVCPISTEFGWDYTILDALASAYGGGKVIGLTREQMANALAVAAVANIGLFQVRVGTLSMWKGAAAGNACRNGVFAALLARRGITGPAEAFTGPKGWMNQLLGKQVELPTFGGDGRIYKIQESKLKYYPADYEAQTSVHPALEIRRAIGGRVDEIEKILVDTYHVAIFIAADTRDKWNPKTRETADHSIPYLMAVALTRGDVWIDDFTEERIRDPKLHELMQKIEIREKEDYTRAYPESTYFHTEAIMRSGERYTAEVRYPKGHPKNPMSDAEVEQKFRRQAAPLMEPAQINTIFERLWQLEDARNMQEIMALFKLKQ